MWVVFKGKICGDGRLQPVEMGNVVSVVLSDAVRP